MQFSTRVSACMPGLDRPVLDGRWQVTSVPSLAVLHM